MPKLTKAERDAIADKLSSPYRMVTLRADGHDLTLAVERCKALKCRVVLYVDGRWEGAWISLKNTDPETRFYPVVKRRSMSLPRYRKAEKALGKRGAKSMFGSWIELRPVYREISFATGRAAVNHLNRVCTDLEVVEPERAPEVFGE